MFGVVKSKRCDICVDRNFGSKRWKLCCAALARGAHRRAPAAWANTTTALPHVHGRRLPHISSSLLLCHHSRKPCHGPPPRSRRPVYPKQHHGLIAASFSELCNKTGPYFAPPCRITWLPTPQNGWMRPSPAHSPASMPAMLSVRVQLQQRIKALPRLCMHGEPNILDHAMCASKWGPGTSPG